jgi:hypothetical protein
LFVVVIVLALFAAGCGGGGSGDGGDAVGTTPSTAAPTTVPVPSTGPGTTVAATNLTLRLTDLRLVNSEESDGGMRILLPTGVASASVTLTGLPSPNRVISVCQARELDRRFEGAACRTPANGDAVTVALGAAAAGLEIRQVGVTGPGAAGNSAALDEVAIRYAASSREVNVRLPQIAAGESGGRPTFGLTPASTDGAYRATLTWMVIPVFGGSPSNGQLELVQGGNVANKADSTAADVRLTGNVPTPVGDVAIRVQNIGASALVSPKLTVLLP